MKKTYLVIALAVFTLVLTGCFGKSATERAVERSIEKQSGGKADVDIKDDSVKINTNEGTFQAGGDVEIPADVPVYPGSQAVSKAQSNTQKDGFGGMYTLTTNDSPEKVAAYYKDYYTGQGWETVGEMTISGTTTLIYKKNETDNASISIGKDQTEEGKTSIVIILSREE